MYTKVPRPITYKPIRCTRGTPKVCDTPWITPPRKQGQTCDLGSNECTKGTPGVQCDPARCVARQGYIIGTQTGSDMRSVVTNNVQKVHLVYNATQQRCMGEVHYRYTFLCISSERDQSN